MEKVSRKAEAVVAVGLGFFGLVFATVGAAYIAGQLGVSFQRAENVVDAIQAGGIALAIILGIFTGGAAALAIAVARTILIRFGRRAAAA